MNPGGFRYRAFISYSHGDEPWALWLHKSLETYRVPARLIGTQTPAGIIPTRLAPIFRDTAMTSTHDPGPDDDFDADAESSDASDSSSADGDSETASGEAQAPSIAPRTTSTPIIINH